MTRNLDQIGYPDLPDAACSGVAHPDVFFPSAGGGHRFIEDKALAMCGVCVEVAPCLAWALAHNPDGVWGGTTYRQRKAARRRRA